MKSIKRLYLNNAFMFHVGDKEVTGQHNRVDVQVQSLEQTAYGSVIVKKLPDSHIQEIKEFYPSMIKQITH